MRLAEKLMMPPSPAEVVRTIVLDTASLMRLGYEVETQGTTGRAGLSESGSVVLVRRSTPRLAYAAPIAAALIAFAVLADQAPGGSISTATYAILGGVCGASVLALLLARTTERVTLAVATGQAGSRVLATGTATTELRDYLRALSAA